MSAADTTAYPTDVLSVNAVAAGFLGKEPPLSVRSDIYGSDDPTARTLKEQLRYVMAGREATFYLDPAMGSDDNCGSSNQPWRTIAHAFAFIREARRLTPDYEHITLILRDGLYTGEGQTYVTLGEDYESMPGETQPEIDAKIAAVTIYNVTIRAQNKHRATLDGGWGPEKLSHYYDEQGNLKDDITGSFFDNVAYAYWKERPSWAPNWYVGAPPPHSAHAAYNTILSLVNCTNVAIDGLRIQNSIGEGVHVINRKYPDASFGEVQAYCRNVTIRNCRIDWCHFGALKCDFDQDTSTIEDNVITRGAFDWWINRDPKKGERRGVPEREMPVDVNGNRVLDEGPLAATANWSATFLWANNATIRGNVCAFSYGEVSSRARSTGALLAANKFIGNYTNCYLQGQRSATVRNNLIVTLPNDHDESTYVYRQDKSLTIANEKKNVVDVWVAGVHHQVNHLNDNLAVYNNLLLYGQVQFRSRAKDFYRPMTRVYFGSNTIVAGPKADDGGILRIFTDLDGQTATISGIVENNLWDNSANRAATLGADVNGIKDTLRVRNNVFPQTGTAGYLVNTANTNVENSIVTDDSQFVQATAVLDITPPLTRLSNAEMDEHLAKILATLADNLYCFGLRSDAIARGAANKNDTPVFDTTIPPEPHRRDYYWRYRDSEPDIGALEYFA